MLLPPLPLRTTRLVALGVSALLVAAAASPAPAATAAQAAEATTRAAPAPAARWEWPLEPPHPVVKAYLAPATAYGAGHRGIDIAAASGSLISTPVDGTVHFAGIVVDRPVLSIRHEGGIITSYEPVTSALSAGEVVRQGEVIGELAVGAGHCASDCLHFGVRLHGEYVSPLNYLGGIPRSVLLPTREPP